ncbi:MAG: hypothetical protein ABEH61_03910 [Haloarculaceae archaeon]
MRSGSPDVSRRTVLRAGTAATALGLLASLAGCQGPLGGGSDGGGRDRIALVPEGAESVVSLDVAGLLADEDVREAANRTLSPYADVDGMPETLEEGLDRATQRWGLDPRGIREVLHAAAFGASTPNAAVIWTDWSRSELFETLRAEGQPDSESTYRDRTVLSFESATGPPTAVTHLDGEAGVFAAGARPSVETLLDRWESEGDSVGGDLREAYTSAQSGYVRFGFDVPTERGPDEASGPVDVTVFRGLTYGYGSLTAEKSFGVTLRADGEEAASDVARVLDAGIDLARKSLADSQSFEQMDTYVETLDRLSVEQQGDTVEIRLEDGGEMLLSFLGAILGSYVLGLGSPQQSSGQGSTGGRPVAPQVAFGFDYEVEAQELQITHEAGDAVIVDELFVTGQGVENGRWDRLGGSASLRSDPPQVAAGDRLTLSDVPPDHVVRVVWEPDGGTSVTLAKFRGPEA